MSELAETIEWGRQAVRTCMERGGVAVITHDDLTRLLIAAETGMTARDAALEEAVFSDLWGYGWVAECIRDAKTGPWHLPKEEVARRAARNGTGDGRQ